MIEESINELSTSAGVGHYNTPKAFKKRPLNEIRINTPGVKIKLAHYKGSEILKVKNNEFWADIHDNYIIVPFMDLDRDKENMSYLISDLKSIGIPSSVDEEKSGVKIPRHYIEFVETLNEISYRKYNQTINTTTPKHKIRKSLRELRRYVKEINTLIDFNNRLKLEMGETNTHHWDSIKEQLDELSKELLQIGKKIKTLHK